jgi:hypothetical protein
MGRARHLINVKHGAARQLLYAIEAGRRIKEETMNAECGMMNERQNAFSSSFSIPRSSLKK